MNNQSPITHLHPLSSRSSRRAVLGLALGAALGSVGVPTSRAGAKPTARRGSRPTSQRGPQRQPKPRTKVVTRTFHTTRPIVIIDEAAANPYPSTLAVSGLKRGKLLDLNVKLVGYSHTYPRDVDLQLVAPNGRSAVIMSDVGGSGGANNLTIVLDDQAALPIANDAIAAGRFQPTNDAEPGVEVDPFPAPAASSPNVALTTFNGINPNGTWKLFLVDDAEDDIGTIAGWALTIKARVRV